MQDYFQAFELDLAEEHLLIMQLLHHERLIALWLLALNLLNNQ
jgi:hypothetical protein